ncbi:AI-2E family transporter [Candidatus Saccharibacteria bacterium]|nr:AI-2E family transporter [Candidatus Saccharibacteria bacterium]
MKTHPLTRKHWYMVSLAAVVLGLFFVAPFLGIIAIAALVAYLFYGIFTALGRKVNAPVAATLTIITSILVIVVPVLLVVTLTAVQVTQLATNLSTTAASDGVASDISVTVQYVNSLLVPLVGEAQAISTDSVLDFLRETMPTVLREMAAFMTQVIGGIPMAIVLSIMYLILLYEFLVHGTKIVRYIVALSPFQPEVTRLYLKRVGLMADAMAKGQLYISFVISLFAALILSVFLGLGEYFLLMTVVFTLLNLIPLGCGIVVIPITLIAMLSGMFWPGLISLVLYIIASNLDAVIRPRIIPPSITLSPGLTMLAAFGGISAYGLLGVVYGPIIMIIVVTSVQIYLDDYATPAQWRRRAQR